MGLFEVLPLVPSMGAAQRGARGEGTHPSHDTWHIPRPQPRRALHSRVRSHRHQFLTSRATLVPSPTMPQGLSTHPHLIPPYAQPSRQCPQPIRPPAPEEAQA